MTLLRKLLLLSGLCYLLRWRQPAQEPREGDAARHHRTQDQWLHEKFYSTWHLPDNPSASCCNDADCCPTEIKLIDGKIYAKRREDGSTFLFHLRKWTGIGIVPMGGTICARRRPMSIAQLILCTASH